GLETLAAEALTRHARAFPAEESRVLPTGGIYAWRRFGEKHMWNPETVPMLQEAARGGEAGRAAYWRFAKHVNEAVTRGSTLRGLLRFADGQVAVPLEEVEPAKEIVKRF